MIQIKTELEQLQEIDQKEKDFILDDVIYLINNIDFEESINGSLDALYTDFITSSKFAELPQTQKEITLNSYKNLVKLNDLINQFQKENNVGRYSK